MARKKIIHVHVQRLKQGLPAVIVREGGRAQHYASVDILGPSKVISDPTRPRSPRTWIETHAEVAGHA